MVKELLDLGHEVVAVDICESGIDDRAVYKNVDIFADDADIYEKLMEPELCIHMAWKDGFVHNSAEHMKNVSKHYLFLCNLIDKGCSNIAVMRYVRSAFSEPFHRFYFHQICMTYIKAHFKSFIIDVSEYVSHKRRIWFHYVFKAYGYISFMIF